MVRVASLAQDALCYRYQIFEDKAPSIERSRALQADLLHTLQQMAYDEDFPITFEEGDKQLMKEYRGGILSLPSSMQPDSIPSLMRPNPNPNLN